MPTPLNAAERRALLREYAAALDKLQVVSAALEDSPPDANSDLVAMYLGLREPVLELLEQYRQRVPRPAVLRCPFTGEVVRHSLDTYGLDGFWWDYEQPIRPPESLPGTWLGWQGSMQLDREAIESPPFLCVPGPEITYVLPALLSREGVKGVLSLLHVGSHVAIVVSYFTGFPEDGLPQMSDWGAAGPAESRSEEMDFDLRKWLRRGKLLWIAPGDAGLALRAELSRCPFLDLRGERTVQRIDRGRLLPAATIRPAAAHAS